MGFRLFPEGTRSDPNATPITPLMPGTARLTLTGSRRLCHRGVNIMRTEKPSNRLSRPIGRYGGQ